MDVKKRAALRSFGKFLLWSAAGVLLAAGVEHFGHYRFDPQWGVLIGGIGKAAVTWWATGRQVAEREMVKDMSVVSKLITEENAFAQALSNAIASGSAQDIEQGAQIAASYIQTTNGLISMLNNPTQLAVVVLECMGLGGKFDPYAELRPQIDAFIAKWQNPQPAQAQAAN